MVVMVNVEASMLCGIVNGENMVYAIKVKLWKKNMATMTINEGIGQTPRDKVLQGGAERSIIPQILAGGELSK